MAFNIAYVVAPLVPLIMVARQPGPATTMYRAGAISPETARRPASVKAKGDLTRSLKCGLLIDLGDGRYYVNANVYERRRRRNLIAMCSTLVLFAVAAAVILEPWRFLG
jgi:hypothetical protein